MSEECFQALIYKFPTYQKFEAFENVLQSKGTEHKLKILYKHKIDYLSAFDSNLYFECNLCKEIRILNIPENPWRGYFLPEEKAIAYKKAINSFNKKEVLDV